MNCFVTGFGPFLEVLENPSALLARDLGLPHQVLEVAYDAVDEWIENVDLEPHDTLLMLGFADRTHMTPELYARNEVGTMHDVRMNQRHGVIQQSGEELLQSNLWTPEVVAKITPDDYVRVSMDAGTYLCNYISYRALARWPEKRVGFLHVPSFSTVAHAVQLAKLKEVVVALNV